MALPGLHSLPPSSKRARSHSRRVSGSITATSSLGSGTPSAPGGVPGVTLMAVPPSLEPYPSTRRHPKRGFEDDPVRGRGLGPESLAEGVVVVVAVLGRGQDVGEGLAHVGEPGGVEAADVVEKARRVEAAGDGHRSSHGQGRRPQGHDGVAVEQRHGAVTHVVFLEAVGLGGAHRDGGQAPLATAHGFGVARRARCEEQEEKVLRRHLGPHHVGGRDLPASRTGPRPLEAGAVLGLFHAEDAVAGHRHVEAVEEPRTGCVGHEQLAVGETDVSGELLSAVGWG